MVPSDYHAGVSDQVRTIPTWDQDKRRFYIAPEKPKAGPICESNRISVRAKPWTMRRYRQCSALYKAVYGNHDKRGGEYMLRLALRLVRPKLMRLCIEAGIDPKAVLKGLESPKEPKPMPDLAKIQRVDSQ